MQAEFEIEPFTRIAWKTKAGKDIWNDRILRISNTYSNAEYEMLKQGYRKAHTSHIDINNLPQMLEKLDRDDLIFTPVAKSAYYQGFSHKHRTPKPDEPFYWYGVVTKTYEDGQKFKMSEREKGNHSVIGELLGYPECCRNYFEKVWTQGYYDPVWQTAEETEGVKVKETETAFIAEIKDGFPESNQTLRYFGVRVVSHFPCSFKCKETKKLSKIWLKVMHQIDREAADWAIELLSAPMEWDSYHGIVKVNTPWFVGITHTYPYVEKNRIIRLNGWREK